MQICATYDDTGINHVTRNAVQTTQTTAPSDYIGCIWLIEPNMPKRAASCRYNEVKSVKGRFSFLCRQKPCMNSAELTQTNSIVKPV